MLLYQSYTFLDGKIQKRQSTLVSLGRNLRKICGVNPQPSMNRKKMCERKREDALNIFTESQNGLPWKGN